MQVCLTERSLTQPPPWKRGLSFHFVSLFHLRKFRKRMFLLFSPLDIISCVVSESTRWERASWETDNWNSGVIKRYFVLVMEPFVWKLDISIVWS